MALTKARFNPKVDRRLAKLLQQAHATAKKKGEQDQEVVRTWQFFLLHNQEHGVFGLRHGNPYALSRREWIEQLVVIDDQRGKAVPLYFNQSQRNLEALVLRSERKGNPLRVVVLKVRQNGISTYVLACIAWLLLTRQNVKCVIVCDREELCWVQLNRLRKMIQRIQRSDGSLWNIPFLKNNREEIAFAAPFNSIARVVSANTPNPGFGETNTVVSMEETSKWPKADEKGKGIEIALPEVPGSYAFDVSQPKGNIGYFADKFKTAWYRELGMATPHPDDEKPDSAYLLNGAGWKPHFIPWFLHELYRWTELGSNPSVLPSRIKDAIERTLTQEERVLLTQRYFLRGKGWRKVDIDQLAWRRYWIAEKCNGNLQTFHEQCPAFPEEAFLASGRPAFNLEHVQRAVADQKREPIFRGNVGAGGRLLPDIRGPLWLWSMPDPDRIYAMGVDTSSGMFGGDPCAACIVDVETSALVGHWYGWEQPHIYGVTVTWLSDAFRAQTAIETHPSQHGLAVFNAAENAGCERLYVQQKWESRQGAFVARKGWVTSTEGKALVLSRVAEALDDQADCPSSRLLQELLDMQLDDKGDIDRACLNDLTMAYGISLKLADLMRVEQIAAPQKQKLPPSDSDEAWWAARRQRQGAPGQYDTLTGQGL